MIPMSIVQVYIYNIYTYNYICTCIHAWVGGCACVSVGVLVNVANADRRSALLINVGKGVLYTSFYFYCNKDYQYQQEKE